MKTAEFEQEITKAGYVPCWVKDIADGDVIIMNGPTRVAAEMPTEMIVFRLWETELSGASVHRFWIGVRPDGSATHCQGPMHLPCWRKVER